MTVYRRVWGGGGIVSYTCADLERGCLMGPDSPYSPRKSYEIQHCKFIENSPPFLENKIIEKKISETAHVIVY